MGINEEEHSESDESIIDKIMKQNNVTTSNEKLKIIRRSGVFNHRFTMILGVDDANYSKWVKEERIDIGWSRCKVFTDLGVI